MKRLLESKSQIKLSTNWIHLKDAKIIVNSKSVDWIYRETGTNFVVTHCGHLWSQTVGMNSKTVFRHYRTAVGLYRNPINLIIQAGCVYYLFQNNFTAIDVFLSSRAQTWWHCRFHMRCTIRAHRRVHTAQCHFLLLCLHPCAVDVYLLLPRR